MKNRRSRRSRNLSNKNGKVSRVEVNHAIIALKKSGQHDVANMLNSLWEMTERKPEDVKRCWHDMARKAQAVCSGNDGLGVVTIRAGVFGNEAVAWDAKFESYDMMEERTTEISAEAMGTLLVLMQDNEPD